MAEPLLLPLEASCDLRLVGGKAAGLAKLWTAGCAVPRGLCITTVVYRRILEAAGCDVAAAWQELFHASDVEQAVVRLRVQRLLAEQPWPPGFMAELAGRLKSLEPAPGVRWAVRSSATNEDAATASAAGLYRTTLGCASEDVAQATRDCWISLWAPHVCQYLQRFGVNMIGPDMAVVIQPMLQAKAAGVAYSIHPSTGRRSQVVVNAVPGLAAPLVSGEASPDYYMVEIQDGVRPPIIRRKLLAKKVQQLVQDTGGLRTEAIPEPDQCRSSLSDSQLLELASFCKQIEQTCRHPVDLEWVWDAERLWVMQVRPITGVHPSDALTNDDCEWTRANLKETLPELPSPLGLSFLERFMEDHLIAHYRCLGCNIDEGVTSVRVRHGRPYLNLTLFYSFTVQLRGNPLLFTEQAGGESLSFMPPVKPLGWFHLLRAGYAMLREWRRVARWNGGHFAEMKKMAEVSRPDRLRDRSPQDLLDALAEMRRWLDRHEMTFGIVGGVAQSLQALSASLPGWLGPDWRVLLNASMQGQGVVVSAQHILRVAELADLARTERQVREWFLSPQWDAGEYRDALSHSQFLTVFDRYLEDYGHRAVGESDIMSPRIAEQPASVLAVVRAQVRGDATDSADEVLRRQAARREEALEEIKRRVGHWPLRWWWFQWWYRRLNRFSALREANRHHLMYYSTAVRHLLLRFGDHLVEQGLLALREDLFYLALEEFEALCAGEQRNWKDLARARREEHSRYGLVQVPDTIRDWQEPIEGEEAGGSQGEGRQLRGVAISAGQAEGPVRIVRSPTDWGRVRQGDILVVPVIDPGLAPLFSVAAGLVAEMGGTLSHGAIMAREYGLPVLVNVPHVTQRLSENEQVKIDCTEGIVRRSAA